MKKFACCGTDKKSQAEAQARGAEEIKATVDDEKTNNDDVVGKMEENVTKEVEKKDDVKPEEDKGDVKVALIIYSMYGHITMMANEVKKGLENVGVKATIYMVPETLPKDILEKMGAPEKPDLPVATTEVLEEADGIMFGIPTRFGMAPAQMKAFWDSTGGLWQKQSLSGKPAGIFFSTGTQNGGQETTALTWVTQLTHHGLIFVPLGYRAPEIFSLDEPHGGSPYGSGTLAGPDGSRMPSDLEKKIAVTHGEVFGSTVKKFSA